jgi:DNA-binding NarL/FixJ family response regulator
MSAVRVVIADDQELIRLGLRLVLGRRDDLEIVGDAADGAAAIELARELEPDVVLMDVQMPGMDGVEACRQIVATTQSKVIMLTTFDLDEYVHQSLRIGASGFLLKDHPPDDLARAIRVVADGDALLAPSVTRRLLERFAGAAPAPAATTVRGAASLSTREVEVWRLMARGLSNAEIGAELFVAESTAKTHVAHVMTKLQARDRVNAVVMAYESGIVHDW